MELTQERGLPKRVAINQIRAWIFWPIDVGPRDGDLKKDNLETRDKNMESKLINLRTTWRCSKREKRAIWGKETRGW